MFGLGFGGRAINILNAFLVGGEVDVGEGGDWGADGFFRFVEAAAAVLLVFTDGARSAKHTSHIKCKGSFSYVQELHVHDIVTLGDCGEGVLYTMKKTKEFEKRREQKKTEKCA